MVHEDTETCVHSKRLEKLSYHEKHTPPMGGTGRRPGWRDPSEALFQAACVLPRFPLECPSSCPGPPLIPMNPSSAASPRGTTGAWDCSPPCSLAWGRISFTTGASGI